MARIISAVMLSMLLFSCQQKQETPAVQQVQRNDNYIPPASDAEIDTTQAYISPSDAFSDHALLSANNFVSRTVKFRGTRNITYQMSANRTGDIVTVVEYLGGITASGDTASTASRMLIYADNELVFRKAFPLEFAGPAPFAAVRKIDHTHFTVTPSKAIVYYWTDREAGGRTEQSHAAVGVDKEGISSEFSGDFSRIGSGFPTVRFLNESRLRARVHPNSRYPYLTIDLFFTVDWKDFSAVMDVPEDTIFTVSEQPTRYFNSKISLFEQPSPTSRSRQTNFRRLTQAQQQRIFVPSFFDRGAVERDFLFIEFNRTTRGWIDYRTMLFEEIVSEQ